MDKKWTRITETGGLTCDADMLSVYKETENFENSIKQNLLFINELDNLIENEKDFQILIEDFKIFKWNVYNDLGYAYNRISEFENALNFYKKSLTTFVRKLANYLCI